MIESIFEVRPVKQDNGNDAMRMKENLGLAVWSIVFIVQSCTLNRSKSENFGDQHLINFTELFRVWKKLLI